MPKHNDLSGLVQGLSDFSTLVEQEAATAFVDIWTRRPPNKPQLAFWESKRHIKAISGANQCLRGDAAVLMWCGDEKRIDCIEVGDKVVAFDFTTGEFVPSQVKAIFTNPGRILHRFKHSQGWLECSQKHKVAVQYPSGRIALVRVMRAVKHQLPVWVDKEGHAELSELTYEGKIGYEPTWDINIDHHDHAFVCNNIVVSNSGKSLAAAVNIAWDATGIYPEWYRGPRTVRGINAWVVGETTELTRDSAQKKLFGPNIDKPGWTDKPGDEALINSKYIIDKPTRKSVSGAIDMVRVKHVPSDTTSLIAFKSHGMETGALASWTGDRAWIDEECPLEILDEIQARMSTTNGYIYCSYCPQHGRTPFVKSMEEEGPDVFLVYMTYDDINHISEEVKARNIRRWSHDPAMLAARTQGHATSNSGLIFPFPTKDILYDPALISIGKRWKFLGGMDVGWTHPTAAVGLALDPMADVVYCYVDYEQDRRPPVYHYGELDRWGRSMTFMIDPASDQVAQKDGEKILEEYWTLAHGAGWENIDEDKRKFIKADNSFLTGMGNLWHRFSTNRLFISKNLKKLIDQYANYEWNKKGDGPMEETPSRKYDIITSLRYGVGGINQYSHILNDFPPWMTAESFEEPIEIKEWSKFRAGGSPPITDQFGHTY
jgi:hypothetical protein